MTTVTRLWFGVALVLFSGAASPQSAERAVQYLSFVQERATYHVVVADVTKDEVSVETKFALRLVPMGKLWEQDIPAAALTGTFFAWENQKPVGDVLLDGDLVAKGRRGSVFAVDWFGKAHIFHPGFRQAIDWFPYRFALRGAVRLVEDGKVVPNPRAQHFRDSSIWGKASRTAAGITAAGKVMFVATTHAVTLSQLGRAMVSQGAVDAVSLDGGGSTAIYYRGKAVVPTGRRLCNMLVIYERSPFDSNYESHLARVAQVQSDSVLKAIGRAKR